MVVRSRSIKNQALPPRLLWRRAERAQLLVLLSKLKHQMLLLAVQVLLVRVDWNTWIRQCISQRILPDLKHLHDKYCRLKSKR